MKKFLSGISILVIAASFCFSVFASQADYAEVGFQNDSATFILLDTDSVSVPAEVSVSYAEESYVESRTMSLYLTNNPGPLHAAAKWNSLPYEVGWRS